MTLNEKILNCLVRSSTPMSTRDVAEALGCGVKHVSNTLRVLHKARVVHIAAYRVAYSHPTRLWKEGTGPDAEAQDIYALRLRDVILRIKG